MPNTRKGKKDSFDLTGGRKTLSKGRHYEGEGQIEKAGGRKLKLSLGKGNKTTNSTISKKRYFEWAEQTNSDTAKRNRKKGV